MTRGFRALCRRQGGNVTIEFSLVFPAAILLIFGIAEFGRAIWAQTTLDYATQSAARCYAINQSTCGTVAQTQQYAVNAAAGLSLTTTNFTVASPSCGAQVGASYTFQFAVPALFPYTLTLSSTACFPT